MRKKGKLLAKRKTELAWPRARDAVPGTCAREQRAANRLQPGRRRRGGSELRRPGCSPRNLGFAKGLSGIRKPL